MFQLAVVDPIPIQGAKMSSKLSKWLLDIKSKRQERNWREFSSLDLFSLTFKKFFSSSFGGGAIALIAPYLTTLKRALLWKEAPMLKISSIRSAVSTELRLVTDGQTWRAMAYNALV